jgi:hypothetical protein
MTLSDLDAEYWTVAGVDILFVRVRDDKPFAGAGVVVVDTSDPPDREALRCALRFADALLLRRGKRWGAVRPSDALLAGNLEPPSWHTSPFAALKHVQARL